MEMPSGIPLEFEKYKAAINDNELFEKLREHPEELTQFFTIAAEDETWCEDHSIFIKAFFLWLTKVNMDGIFSHERFLSLVPIIHKRINMLRPFIPLDLLIRSGDQEYLLNSLLVAKQSQYFERRLFNECRGQEEPFLRIDPISTIILSLLEEFCFTGEIKDLWKLNANELFDVIEQIKPFGIPGITQSCEMVLKRYIDRDNVFDRLIAAHQKSLQILQDACIEFINELNTGVKLIITPVEKLSLEFLNFKTSAMETFQKLSIYITHLAFAKDLPAQQNFVTVINLCPQLVGLDLSDSTVPSTHFDELPERIKELYISRCPWISNAMLQTLSAACPNIYKLDISSNDPLTYAIWSEINKFKNLKILNVSRCFQIGDHELKMILEAAPKVVELHLVDCQRISQDAFFEIPKKLKDLTVLDISKTLISDAALIDIMIHCKSLMILNLSRCYNISDKAVMEGIRNSAMLKQIDLTNSNISPHTLEQIKKPGLEIIL